MGVRSVLRRNPEEQACRKDAHLNSNTAISAHFPDSPTSRKNYHIVTMELFDDGAQTCVSLSQDNNSTEQEREHSESNWGMMLTSLKKFLEE